jgi:hypothetical protein
MFNQDYNDLLRLLSARNVNYVIVGAYAMAAHGIVRGTGRTKDKLDLELLSGE